MNQLLSQLYSNVPQIEDIVWNHEVANNFDKLWPFLKDFMSAHSPSSSVFLPGTIIDNLSCAVNKLGLKENYHKNFKGIGNAGLLIGAKKEKIDLIVDAHIDEPTFGISEIYSNKRKAKIFACCANRFPIGEKYEVPCKLLRYDIDKKAVRVCGKGSIISIKSESGHKDLSLELTEGDMDYTDLITMNVPGTRENDKIIGSAIDDAGGSIIILITATILKQIEPLLIKNSVNCLFTFSDNEEWPPESFFASGASKTCFALDPPTFGSIVVDIHQIDYRSKIEMGKGISCGLISAMGAGAALPMNYQRLTTDLINSINSKEKNIAQLNTGYFSRSDDHAFTRWSKILGLIGIPSINIHKGNEEGNIRDIRGGIIFLSHYIPVVLGLSEILADQYQISAIKES